MLWLLDKNLLENYSFAQIFYTEPVLIDENSFYDLNLTQIPIKKIDGITPTKYSFRIYLL